MLSVGAVTTQGDVLTWGANTFGQLGVIGDHSEPVRVQIPE